MDWQQLAALGLVLLAAAYLVLRARRKRGLCGGCGDCGQAPPIENRGRATQLISLDEPKPGVKR